MFIKQLVRYKKQLIVVLIAACTTFFIILFHSLYVGGNQLSYPNPWFIKQHLPKQLEKNYWLFDLGTVDANEDGVLDIFTSNHFYRQTLLLGDGDGEFINDVLSQWRLNQNPEFPGLDMSNTKPPMDEPGLYIYWQNECLNIQTHRLPNIGSVTGEINLPTKVEIKQNKSFLVDIDESQIPSGLTQTNIKFTVQGDGQLALSPHTKEVPVLLKLNDRLPLKLIYIGTEKVSPNSHNLDLSLQDRHGMAWADYNGDGQLDVFISSGGMGGTIGRMPQKLKEKINDELMVRNGKGKFKNRVTQSGIVKGNCSGRHVTWVDFDGDNRLDLYINCQDRGIVSGEYPKQFYRQDADGKLTDVAAEVGLDIPSFELSSFAWLDADGDRDMDFLGLQDNGIWLYVNQSGKFEPKLIYSYQYSHEWRKGQISNAWRFDPQLTMTDYDLDGDLDVFIASKTGNTLLVNNAGTYFPADLASIGLPLKGLTANWVDYDNDGLPDLHVVPSGVFRQRPDGKFEATHLGEFPESRFNAALCTWFDLNNDGSRDVLIALNEKSEKFQFRWFWRSIAWLLQPLKGENKLWQAVTYRAERDNLWWKVEAYRNDLRSMNHWLQLKLIGPEGNRQAIGAQAIVTTPEGKQLQQVGSSEGAFFSQGHYRLYFGLGRHERADSIEILWPDGQRQQIKDVGGDRLLTILMERENSR